MEDSHTHILSLPDDPEAAFFAVYDGHGGSNVAEYAGKNLHKYIVKQSSYKTNIPEALKQVRIIGDCLAERRFEVECSSTNLHSHIAHYSLTNNSLHRHFSSIRSVF